MTEDEKKREAQRLREVWERTGWCSKAPPEPVPPVRDCHPFPGADTEGWFESGFPEDITLGQVLQFITDSILLMGSRKIKRIAVEFYEQHKVHFSDVPGVVEPGGGTALGGEAQGRPDR